MSSTKRTPKTASKRKKADGEKKARIFLVDDHGILRAGVAHLIEQENDMTIAGESGTASEALGAISQLSPDLIILDLSLVGYHGIDLLKDIHIQYPRMPVLMLSMHDEKLYAQRCLQEGAKGYLMKDQAPAKLLQAIRTILKGGIYLSESMTSLVLHHISGGLRSNEASPLRQLTTRELQVLQLLGQGCGSREIAATLRISVKTVEAHRENIKAKLNLKDAPSLVHFAVVMSESHGGAPFAGSFL